MYTNNFSINFLEEVSIIIVESNDIPDIELKLEVLNMFYSLSIMTGKVVLWHIDDDVLRIDKYTVMDKYVFETKEDN